MALSRSSGPVSLPASQLTTKPPSASAVIEDASCHRAVAALTRISPPTLLPAASNSCALIEETVSSALGPLPASQLTTKPPFFSAVTEDPPCEPAVTVLTRISPPTLLPAASKTCALTDDSLSSQVTTKPPFASAVIDAASCAPAVAVLTRSSPPILLPSAPKTCALTDDSLSSPPAPLLSS